MLWTRCHIVQVAMGCCMEPSIVNLAVKASFLEEKLYSPLQYQKKCTQYDFFSRWSFFFFLKNQTTLHSEKSLAPKTFVHDSHFFFAKRASYQLGVEFNKEL